MLAIRLQRVGRKGNAIYRVIVQEAQKSPTSGKVVAFLGSYNPHTKEANLKKDMAQKYLDNGAQPSPRVIKLLESAKVKLPTWVKKSQVASKSIKNIDKLRKNKPAEEVKAEAEVPASDEKAEVEEIEAEVLSDKDTQ